MTLPINKLAKLLDRPRRSLALVSLLAAFLLLVQSADLVHTHDGDLQAQLDCEICLKVGGEDDAIVIAKLHQPSSSAQLSVPTYESAVSSLAVFSANPRAPPRA